MVYKTKTKKNIEERYGKPLRDIVNDLYIGCNMSLNAVADELGVSKRTLVNWRRELGVPRKVFTVDPSYQDDCRTAAGE